MTTRQPTGHYQQLRSPRTTHRLQLPPITTPVPDKCLSRALGVVGRSNILLAMVGGRGEGMSLAVVVAGILG
jgi:hypothetical protein